MEIVTRAGFPSPLTTPRLSSFASAALTRANSVAATSGASRRDPTIHRDPFHQLRGRHGLWRGRAGAHLGRRES